MFGRTRICQVPPAALLDRFVDRDEHLAGTLSSEGMDDESEDG